MRLRNKRFYFIGSSEVRRSQQHRTPTQSCDDTAHQTQGGLNQNSNEPQGYQQHESESTLAQPAHVQLLQPAVDSSSSEDVAALHVTSPGPIPNIAEPPPQPSAPPLAPSAVLPHHGEEGASFPAVCPPPNGPLLPPYSSRESLTNCYSPPPYSQEPAPGPSTLPPPCLRDLADSPHTNLTSGWTDTEPPPYSLEAPVEPSAPPLNLYPPCWACCICENVCAW